MARVVCAIGAAGEQATAPVSPQIPFAMTAILRRAEPVYATRMWPAHDRENRAFIARVTPLVTAHEAAMMRGVTKALRGAWPRHHPHAGSTP